MRNKKIVMFMRPEMEPPIHFGERKVFKRNPDRIDSEVVNPPIKVKKQEESKRIPVNIKK